MKRGVKMASIEELVEVAIVTENAISDQIEKLSLYISLNNDLMNEILTLLHGDNSTETLAMRSNIDQVRLDILKTAQILDEAREGLVVIAAKLRSG